MTPARVRCRWCAGDPLLEAYHDDEWGYPPPQTTPGNPRGFPGDPGRFTRRISGDPGGLTGDRAYFERLTLEVFQAGLNWRMIVHKRPAIRKAFARFNIARVARFGSKDVERALQVPEMIRNRLKVEATVANARAVQEVVRRHGSFAAYLDSLDSQDRKAMYADLRRRFKFMGPTLAESFLMSIGKIPAPHEPACWRAQPPRRRSG